MHAKRKSFPTSQVLSFLTGVDLTGEGTGGVWTHMESARPGQIPLRIMRECVALQQPDLPTHIPREQANHVPDGAVSEQLLAGLSIKRQLLPVDPDNMPRPLPPT